MYIVEKNKKTIDSIILVLIYSLLTLVSILSIFRLICTRLQNKLARLATREELLTLMTQCYAWPWRLEDNDTVVFMSCNYCFCVIFVLGTVCNTLKYELKYQMRLLNTPLHRVCVFLSKMFNVRKCKLSNFKESHLISATLIFLYGMKCLNG